MKPELIVGLIWPLVIIGGVVYFMIWAYRRYEQFHQIRYRMLASRSLPLELSELARAVRDLGFTYLATYGMQLPPVYRAEAPDSYVFHNGGGATYAFIVQHNGIRGVAFQTVFPDGALLLTLHDLPKSGLWQTATDKNYRVIQVHDSLDKALQTHEANQAQFIVKHGEPVRSQSGGEFVDFMNQYVVSHSQQRIANYTVGLYRRILFGALLLCSLLLGVFLFAAIGAGTQIVESGYIFVLLVIPLPFLPIIGTAWWLAHRIRRKQDASATYVVE